MNKLLVAFLFCLTSSIANAQAFQSSKFVLCTDTKSLMEGLGEKYKEKPIWLGQDLRDETRYSLFINEKDKTWTFVQFTTEVACILGVGSEFQMILGEKI